VIVQKYADDIEGMYAREEKSTARVG
jgi:hypothetical protein